MKKSTSLLLALVLVALLTACAQRGPADSPQAPSQPQESSQSQPSQPEPQPVTEHDKAWWWQNYVQDMVYLFQGNYPTGSPMLDQQLQLEYIIVRAARGGDTARIADVKGDETRITRQQADEYARQALGLADASSIYLDYCSDEEGNPGLYCAALMTDPQPETTGNWAFELRDVRLPETGVVELVVGRRDIDSPDQYEGNTIFTMVHSGDDVYSLRGVRRENARDPKAAAVTGAYRRRDTVLYPLENTQMAGSVGSKAVFWGYSYSQGLVELTTLDTNAFEEGPLDIVTLKLARGEGFQEARVLAGNVVVATNREMRIYPLGGDTPIKTVALPQAYRQDRGPSQDAVEAPAYIFSDDLGHMAYAGKEGLMLYSFADDKLTKVADHPHGVLEPGEKFYSYVFAMPVEFTKEGLLRYNNSGYGVYSLNDAQYYDPAAQAAAPSPYNITDVSTQYSQVVGNRALAFPDPMMGGDFAMKILEISTGKAITIPAEMGGFQGIVWKNGVLALTTRPVGGGNSYSTLSPIDLETGAIRTAILTLEGPDLRYLGSTENGRILLGYNGIVQDYDSGFLLLEP